MSLSLVPKTIEFAEKVNDTEQVQEIKGERIESLTNRIAAFLLGDSRVTVSVTGSGSD